MGEDRDREETDMNQEREQTKPKGLTRREFLRRAGVATVAGAAAGVLLPDLI